MDSYVGARIRAHRQKLGWTLADLAQRVAISPQQLQKYEYGATRVSASLLYKISSVMGKRTDDFFEGALQVTNTSAPFEKSSFPQNRTHPLYVLLVEYDPAEALVTRRAIERSRIKTKLHMVSTHDQALDFLRNKQSLNSFPRPEIILLELQLRQREGDYTLRSIKRDRNLMDIPVVILTHSAERKELIGAYQNNAAGFIAKPSSFRDYCQSLSLLFQYWSRVVSLPHMDKEEKDPLT